MYCMPGADVYGMSLDSMAMSGLDVHNKLPYFDCTFFTEYSER
jgi:hypothetical protein